VSVVRASYTLLAAVILCALSFQLGREDQARVARPDPITHEALAAGQGTTGGQRKPGGTTAADLTADRCTTRRPIAPAPERPASDDVERAYRTNLAREGLTARTSHEAAR
jgi:hypothetical protein